MAPVQSSVEVSHEGVEVDRSSLCSRASGGLCPAHSYAHGNAAAHVRTAAHSDAGVACANPQADPNARPNPTTHRHSVADARSHADSRRGAYPDANSRPHGNTHPGTDCHPRASGCNYHASVTHPNAHSRPNADATAPRGKGGPGHPILRDFQPQHVHDQGGRQREVRVHQHRRVPHLYGHRTGH